MPARLIESCRTLDVGVTYSDRFLKDNIGTITAKAGIIKVRLFCSDVDDSNIAQIVSSNTGVLIDDLMAEYRKLIRIVEELKSKGVDIEVWKQKAIPHYSFYIIDESYYFMTTSTFASRRATVPLFQAERSSPLASLMREDREHIIALTASADPVLAVSVDPGNGHG